MLCRAYCPISFTTYIFKCYIGKMHSINHLCILIYRIGNKVGNMVGDKLILSFHFENDPLASLTPIPPTYKLVKKNVCITSQFFINLLDFHLLSWLPIRIATFLTKSSVCFYWLSALWANFLFTIVWFLCMRFFADIQNRVPHSSQNRAPTRVGDWYFR